jgi:hypothetical protein
MRNWLLNLFGMMLALFTWGCLAEESPPDDTVATPSIVGVPTQGKTQGVVATFSGATVRSGIYKVASTSHGATTDKVAVVMAGGYAQLRVAADVAQFRTDNSLHSVSSLTVKNQTGGSTLPATLSQDWEQAGIAGLAIGGLLADDPAMLLIECDSANWSDLDLGIKRAKAEGAKFIVLPFTLASDPGDGTTFASGALYFAGTGIAAQPQFPAMSGKVVAVAPTRVVADMSVRGYAETLASGAALGCSSRSKPGFQADSICPSNRTLPDFAALGDADTIVQIKYTPAGGSQQTINVSGPGVGAALIGSWFALDNTRTISNVYSNAPTGLFDLGAAGFDASFGNGSPNQ